MSKNAIPAVISTAVGGAVLAATRDPTTAALFPAATLTTTVSMTIRDEFNRDH